MLNFTHILINYKINGQIYR